MTRRYVKTQSEHKNLFLEYSFKCESKRAAIFITGLQTSLDTNQREAAFANMLQERKPLKKGDQSSITQLYFGNHAGESAWTSSGDLPRINMSPQESQGGNVYAATAYRCIRPPEVSQGMSVFTQQQPISLKTCPSGSTPSRAGEKL